MKTSWTALSGLVVLGIAGCSTTGTGDRVLIQDRVGSDHADAQLFFPSLLVSSDVSNRDRVQVLRGTARGDYRSFERYMVRKYGGTGTSIASFDVTIRDKASMPALMPVSAFDLLGKGVGQLAGNLQERSLEKLIDREDFLRARILNTPRMPPRTTFHHYYYNEKDDEDKKNGVEVFFYYPQIEVDFSASLLSPNVADSFSMLGLVVRLREPQQTPDKRYTTRIVDYDPKAADLQEFVRGTFNQSATLQSKSTGGASLSRTMGGVVSAGSTANPVLPANVTMSDSGTAGLTANQELSFTWTEAYASELRDALERRKTGVLENGRTFFADFRSLREKRIAGTYSFELQLEVPSNLGDLSEGFYPNQPVQSFIEADVYLVGVVRHVYKTGRKGRFIKVPEYENDDVFEQVILVPKTKIEIWRTQGEQWASLENREKPAFSIEVQTNRDDATFYLQNSSGEVVDIGKGREATLRGVANGDSYRVKFLGISHTPTSAPAIRLTASPSPPLSSLDGTSSSVKVIGDFHP